MNAQEPRTIHYVPPLVVNRKAVTGPTACGTPADGRHITFQEHKANCAACVKGSV